MTGRLTFGNASVDNSPSVRWQDKKRHVWMGTSNGGGDFYFYDDTNGKSIIHSKANGENVFYGRANSANAVAWENVSGKPSTFPPTAHNHDDRYSNYIFDGTNTVSIPSGWNALGTTMGSVDFQPGTYLVLIYAIWDSKYDSTAGSTKNGRQIEFGTASANNYYVTGTSPGPVGMGQELFGLLHVTKTTKYYFRAKQFSGGNLACEMSAAHIKLK